MSKVANMLNMVKILEDGKIHTIQDLADELEVSTRMIRIYKQELEQAGIYIQGKQGINGGYILDNMKSTIDIGLTGEEIYQLKNMKKNELDEAIINKIIKAYITNEHRKDNTKSKQLMPEFTEIYKDFRLAINNRNKIFIEFKSVNSGKTKRIIHPAELFTYLNNWYVAAFCELRNEIRLFKLNDIISYKILDKKYEEVNLKIWSKNKTDNYISSFCDIIKSQKEDFYV